MRLNRKYQVFVFFIVNGIVERITDSFQECRLASIGPADHEDTKVTVFLSNPEDLIVVRFGTFPFVGEFGEYVFGRGVRTCVTSAAGFVAHFKFR